MIERNIVLSETELRIRRYIINAIHNGKVKGISYTAINEDLDLGLNFANRSDGAKIGKWLGHVSTYEFEHNRPILSVMIMYQQANLTHGEGFYDLLEELTGVDKNVYMSDIRRVNRLVDDCTHYWINSENYTAHAHLE